MYPAAAAKSLQSCSTLCDPRDGSRDSPGRNTGVGLPFPAPGDLPDPGIEAESLASSALTG